VKSLLFWTIGYKARFFTQKCNKLALTCNPDPIQPSRKSHYPNRPKRRGIFWKLALTHTPDPNRSTFITFVHVNVLADVAGIHQQGHSNYQIRPNRCKSGQIGDNLLSKSGPFYKVQIEDLVRFGSSWYCHCQFLYEKVIAELIKQ